jgi:isoquinoline 1-oxidoreductase beta subunit
MTICITTTYHTVSVEHLQAGLDAQGKTTAWLHRSVAPTIVSTFAPDPQHEAPFEPAWV